MSNYIILLIGVLIGSSLGILSFALISAGKFADLWREIEDLRATRILLKEEIIKLDNMTKARKPTPRKYRKKQK
tara:strand:- start:855 stop:1076 length:222 start_codon:yes stop_codon:yes gene_type:complete